MLNNKELFNNIKTLCDEKGIKITNLEKELGFGGGIISRWGNNADPSLSKIVDIADYFNVTIDELIGRNSNKQHNQYQYHDNFIPASATQPTGLFLYLSVRLLYFLHPFLGKTAMCICRM